MNDFTRGKTSNSNGPNIIQGMIEQFCLDQNLAHATFQLISTANNGLTTPYVKTTYPLDWIRFYLLNNLMSQDPVLRVSQSSRESFFWQDIPLTSREKNIIIYATEHGLSSNGYTVPTLDVGPYRGLLSILPHVDSEESSWCEYIDQNVKLIDTFAYELHGIARIEVDPYDSYVSDLSPREIECLEYISIGKTNTEIAAILALSEHTIRSYCRTLRLKLNCSTLAQAVAKACALRII